MIKAFEYRIGFGSPDAQLEKLNEFINSLDEDDSVSEYEIFTETTGKGVLFYVDYEKVGKY